jgi:23S rRNA (uracil1939-C5)-methyltransferase
MASVGQLLTVRIEKPAAGGRMIAHAEGGVLFVAGAIPGELVVARVTRVARGVAFADVVTIEEASPDRHPPFCDPACGGTSYAHIAYERQLAIKADVIADGLSRIGRITPPSAVRVAASRTDGYRMRARMHVQGGRIGFFREGTHQLCDARGTGQLLAETCDVLDRLAAVLQAQGVTSIRELDVSENIDASSRAVHLDSATGVSRARFEALGGVVGLSGLTMTAAGPPGGAPDSHLVAGDPYVFDQMPLQGSDVRLRRHVQSFFQGNRYLLAALVGHVVSLVPARDSVVDLYAGVGVFAMALAQAGAASVRAVESDPFAARDLEVNASADGRVTVHHQLVEHFLARRQVVADTVVVDPPRTGLSPEAVQGLLTLAAAHIVYVSCDVATFARDARALVAAGYQLERLDAFDLFPNTPHVETVAAFRR